MHWMRTVAGAAIVAGALAFSDERPEPPPLVHVSTPTPTAGLPIENPLDTEVDASTKPPPPPTRDAGPYMPHGHRPVRTPADEDLPEWCPVTGRLTVFESSDMAENLGLIPPGTTKAHPEKIFSVAELLEEEAAKHPKPAGPTYIMGETFVDAR